jgi:hypothetical protein
VAGLALFGAPWARANIVPPPPPLPGHFEINLNDFFGTTDGGGWGANTTFNDAVNTGVSSDPFTQNIFCVGGCGRLDDPYISINKGGHSVPFPSSFQADQNGGGILDFFDAGPPIHDILITTNLNLTLGETFHCESDIFSFCGFKDSPTQVDILFTNGTIPTAVPEPTSGILLLTALSVMVVVRRLFFRKATI